jgi:hypothetical protein
MGTYAVLALWLLAGSIVDLIASRISPFWIRPAQKINPFFLALAPSWWPQSVVLSDYFWFLGITVALSVVLVAIMVWRLRSACLRERAPMVSRSDWLRPARNAWRLIFGWIPWLRPSLDGNPVLWREWHRSASSRLSRVIMGLFGVLSAVCSTVVICGPAGEAGAWVNGLQVSIGLLLLSVAATTSLGEERAHGSLDLLLITPLSTRQIVMGKWLGAYRMVPLLAIMPAILIGCAVLANNWTLCWAFPLMIAYVLASGAAITSLGLAMATSIARLGRAIGVTVTLYVAVAAGWVFLATALGAGPGQRGPLMASPFFWAGGLTFEVRIGAVPESPIVAWAILWTIACAWAGVRLIQFTLCDFDRRLGRIEQLDARQARPSRLARASARIYLWVAVALGILGLSREWAPAAIALQFMLGSLVLAGTAALRSSDDERTADRGFSRVHASLLPRPVLACWAGAYGSVVPVIVPSLMLFLLHAREVHLGFDILCIAVYMLSVSAASVSLGVAIAVWARQSGWTIALVTVFWALWNAGWLAIGEALGGQSEWSGFALGMGNPFLGVSSLCSASIHSGFGRELTVACALMWSFVYALAAVLLLRRTILALDSSSGFTKAGRAWTAGYWPKAAPRSS